MDAITNAELVIYAAVLFVVSIAGSVAGAGGGFIMTPLLIFLGLSPAQAVSTGKVGGLAVSLGALRGMKSVKIKDKILVTILMLLALMAGIISPFIITRLDAEVYKIILGIILLVLAPILYIKKIGHTEKAVNGLRKVFGVSIVAFALGLQGVFSGGLGSLVVIGMTNFLGMSALQANVVKRYVQLVLNSSIVIGLISSGLIIWEIAIMAVCIASVAGYFGGRLAVKKGNVFVMNTMLAFMLVSAFWLIFS